MTTKAIEVIFDETQSLSVTDAMYVFHIHEDFDPWAILGLIHSNIFLFLYKVSNQGDARVIPQVKASKLSTIPVPTRAFFSSTARKLADCTQKLCSITRDIANLPSQTIGSKTTDLEGEIYQLTVEMNMLVSSLYELDDKDESLVNLSLQGLQRS
jgi:hypothetical protein